MPRAESLTRGGFGRGSARWTDVLASTVTRAPSPAAITVPSLARTAATERPPLGTDKGAAALSVEERTGITAVPLAPAITTWSPSCCSPLGRVDRPPKG